MNDHRSVPERRILNTTPLQLISPELAEMARQANQSLLEVITRPFPYEGWTEATVGEDPLWDTVSWFESEKREYDSDRGLLLAGIDWLITHFIKGEKPETSIQVLQSLAPLLRVAEQINAPWIYVTTVAAVFPIIHMLESFFIETILCNKPEENEKRDSWASQFGQACTRAEQVYCVFLHQEPVTPGILDTVSTR